MCLVELYCSVDDFWKSFKYDWDKHLIDSGRLKRGPEPKLGHSRNDGNRHSISPIE